MPSTIAMLSCSLTPMTAHACDPRSIIPRAYAGPKLRSRSIAVRKPSTLQSGKFRASTRSSNRWYRVRVASRVVGVRRSRALTSSSIFGCAWPSRLAESRRLFARSVTETMFRTTLRSSFHRCSEQRPYSVEIECFAERRSKRTCRCRRTTRARSPRSTEASLEGSMSWLGRSAA